ncbi:MAG TPA: hypothetical protein VHH15_15500 [Actinophytocola sp.]|nr:hypothetical protein [Actinophytocola sp.]
MRRRLSSLADEEFRRLFLDFEYTAYRLEALQHYDVPYEREAFERFLAGETTGAMPGLERWTGGAVANAVAAGKRLHRVHVVEEPLSDYVRFECAWAYAHTSRAGEEIRILPVARGEWPGTLPRHDYWLFDSRHLVTMHYGPAGDFRHAEIVDDPADVVRANYWRDHAVTTSVPYPEFAARYDYFQSS